MVWQPAGSVGSTPVEGPRCGTVRPSMAKNPLLAKAELGKVKPLLFNQPDDEHVFGFELPKDPENARELTGIWKEHTPSPGHEGQNRDGKPMADFKRMNITAAVSGVTTAKDQPSFRAQNTVHVKKFEAGHAQKHSKPLPSDKNAKHIYGMPSTFRTADVVRQCGPEEPPMKYVMQGVFTDEWVRANTLKTDQSAGQGAYLPPVPTRAALGHAIGAQKYLQPHHAGEEWKMSKFTKVPSRVTAYMGGKSLQSSSFGRQEQAGEGGASPAEHRQDVNVDADSNPNSVQQALLPLEAVQPASPEAS